MSYSHQWGDEINILVILQQKTNLTLNKSKLRHIPQNDWIITKKKIPRS